MFVLLRQAKSRFPFPSILTPFSMIAALFQQVLSRVLKTRCIDPNFIAFQPSCYAITETPPQEMR